MTNASRIIGTVALTIGGACLAMILAVVAFHVALVVGFTVYHLMHS